MVTLDGRSLTFDDVARVARHRETIAVDPAAIARINHCRELLERKMAAGEVMYGVNTGIGELATVRLTPEQASQFQRYLLYSHAAGCGEPCDEEDIRAGILSRLNTHCWGHSGCLLRRRKSRSAHVGEQHRCIGPGVKTCEFDHPQSC